MLIGFCALFLASRC